jgi:hypothetical protein
MLVGKQEAEVETTCQIAAWPVKNPEMAIRDVYRNALNDTPATSLGWPLRVPAAFGRCTRGYRATLLDRPTHRAPTWATRSPPTGTGGGNLLGSMPPGATPG